MKRPRFIADPLADYDGLVQYGNVRITPERRTEIAAEQLRAKACHPFIVREDDEANRTPVGGMQFR